MVHCICPQGQLDETMSSKIGGHPPPTPSPYLATGAYGLATHSTQAVRIVTWLNFADYPPS